MKNYLKNLNKKHLGYLKKITVIVDKLNQQAFLVGGFVRDTLINRRSNDIDIVVEGDAMSVAHLFSKRYLAEIIVHKRFKTATVLLNNGDSIDFVTARKEIYKCSGDLPKVLLGDINSDMHRRDISINALAISINKETFGCLYDECGGVSDLHKKQIKILYEKSFVDDPTRIFRVIRYEQRLGFKMNRWTMQCLQDSIRGGVLNRISKMRYYNEFKKVCEEEESQKILKRLNQWNVLKVINLNGEVNYSIISCVFNNLKRIKGADDTLDNYYGRLIMLAYWEEISKSSHEDISFVLPFEKEMKEAIKYLKDITDIMRKLSGTRKWSKIYVLLKPLPEMVLYYLRVRTNSVNIRKRIERFLNKMCFESITLVHKDFVKIGFKEGKVLGEVKQEILFAKMDGKVLNKKDEFNLAKRLKEIIR